MNISAASRVAFRSLNANKVRSSLTMLGMIIGVAAVIAMLAIGNAAQTMISDQIASIGSNLILVIPGTMTATGVRTGAGGQQTLTMADAKAIGSELSAVRYAAPSNRTGAPIVYGNMNWTTQVQGSTPDFFAIREWPATAGRLILESEVEGDGKVVVLGATVAENIFGSEDPVGKVVRIKKVPFTVVGVLARKGQSPQGTDQDDTAVVPITTAMKKLSRAGHNSGSVGVILTQAASPDRMTAAEDQIRELLRQRHRIGKGEDDDFSVRNLTEMFEAAEASTKVMGILLGAIASVSLIVGGIGIMNIMLVSVTERTREIGIRMAVGARERDIMLQFLIEAIGLSVLGGTIGIGVGVGGATAISAFAGWSTLVSGSSIALSFGFSVAVGVFFGWYPAKKASSLDPIEALRYE